MKDDKMLTMMEAWILAMEGRDPSEAIENQERRGQAEVVRTQRLPVKVNSNSIPNEIFFKGVDNKMSYDERKKVTDLNLMEWTREQYKKMGIKVIDNHDDLFWNVQLPEGWEIKPTEHHMWNVLIDDKGRQRARFFYKAAFYDRDAFINFSTRFNLEVTHVADYNEDYDVWRKSDIQGMIKDGEIIIQTTRSVPAVEDYNDEDKIKKELWEELEAFMKDHYPDYKNINAYWD